MWIWQFLLKYNIIKHGEILKEDIETKIKVESGILSERYLNVSNLNNIILRRFMNVIYDIY